MARKNMAACVVEQSIAAFCAILSAKAGAAAGFPRTRHGEQTMSTKSNNTQAGASASGRGAGQDAIALLIADHREASDIFEEFENLGDRAKASKKKLADKVCKALVIHTMIEEEIFYPALRAAMKDKDMQDKLDEAVVEHAAAKDLIRQIQEMDADEDLYDAKVKVLGEEIEHHVEEEEKEMFPKVQKSDLDLVALGQEMALRKQELQDTL
jgi:hemerythrin-like domain-containing protein